MSMKVIGYKDLRPFDWVSGKRMPLEPGAGHICDRCQREHAIVYTLLDTDTNKQYDVGSGCAKQSFGFDPSKDKEAKLLEKNEKSEKEKIIVETRLKVVEELLGSIIETLLKAEVPEVNLSNSEKYKTEIVTIGDSKAYVSHRTREETIKVATITWFDNRIVELIPEQWKNYDVPAHPGSTSKSKTSMFELTRRLAARYINSKLKLL